MTDQDGGRWQEAGRVAALEAELAGARERLREADHRIKNDLQLIASVFVLQTRRLPEGHERKVARNALDRVNAVAAVHRRLDVGGDPRQFDASALVRDLTDDAAAAARRSDVQVTLSLGPVTIPARQAAPLALIVGELVRNSLRHAFPGRGGEIKVGFAAEDGVVSLSVRDDGAGLADPAARGFGTTLVGLLAQQLRGEFELAEAEPGVRATVRFPQTAPELSGSA